jgi:tetratricopeptide (TPR) repeat protein
MKQLFLSGQQPAHHTPLSNPLPVGTNQPSWLLKKFLMVSSFLLAVGAGLGFGYAASQQLKIPQISAPIFKDEQKLLLVIAASGAFGGLLYTLQSGKLQLPYISETTISNPPSEQISESNPRLTLTQNQLTSSTKAGGKTLNPGYIADCLIGIGGAFAVFLLIPNADTLGKKDNREINFLDIELLATTLVGGYGGRFLLDRAVNNIGKRVAETEERVNQSIGEIQKVQQKVEDLNEIESQVKKLLSRYLDKSLGLLPEQVDELKRSIPKASSATRTDIFVIAQKVLYENRGRSTEPNKVLAEKTLEVMNALKSSLPNNTNLVDSTFEEVNNLIQKMQINATIDTTLVERTLEVFNALKRSDENGNHRYVAHAAYAHMALQKWQDAIRELDEAIQLRDTYPQNRGDREGFWVYECNRALCRIKLADSIPNIEDAEELHKLILRDLRFVKGRLKDCNKSLKDIEQFIEGSDLPIKTWMNSQGIQLEML